MKTILEVLQLSTDFLREHGLSNPRREAETLLCDLLNIPRMRLYLDFDRPLEESELQKMRLCLKRRKSGEPASYIHGSQEFYGCQLQLTAAVLIPRQETEILVDMVANILQKEETDGKRLLDLCTGSGCIGLALKKKLHHLEVHLCDISPQALEVARINAIKNQLDVHLMQGDLLSAYQGRPFDYVVCNPPYISQRDYALLSPEVRDFEPRQALLAGPTGLEFYRRLKEELPLHLTRKAKVWLEIGSDQGAAVQALFDRPPWRSVSLQRDFSQRDRFISLEME